MAAIKKYGLLPIAILAALVLLVVFTPIKDFFLKEHLNHKAVAVPLERLLDDGWEMASVDLPEGAQVYKKEVHIQGEIDQPILFQGRLELTGKVDTTYIQEWYIPYDSLYIKAPEEVSGELKFKYKFYFTVY